MHEAAIVQGVLDVAFREARKHGATRVNKIKLRLGEFRGVVREALEFCFMAMKQDTMAAYAELEVETIQLRVVCPACGEIESSPNDINLLCPTCDEPLTILAGQEMQIEYLDLE